MIPAAEVTELASTQSTNGIFRQLLRRRLAVAGLLWVILVVVVAICAPLVAPHSPLATNLFETLKGPSAAHLLGTDQEGRDVLSRLIWGTRPTLVAIVIALSVALGIGVPIGVASGYLGGRFDQVVRWITDMTLSFPGIIVVFIVLSVFQGNMTIGMLALGILASPGITRIIRAATLAIRNELYVEAAWVAGLNRRQIMIRHIVPRIKGPIIVQASLLASVSIFVAVGLAFLGIGVQPPNPTWGSMLSDGFQAIEEQTWLVIPVSVVILLTSVSFGVIGDAARDTATAAWMRPAANRSRRSRHRVRVSTPIAHVEPSVLEPSPLELSANYGGLTNGVPPNGVVPPRDPNMNALLSVKDLCISFPVAGSASAVTVVSDVSFDVVPGETVGLVGESGCGKTVVAKSIIGLLSSGGFVSGGSVHFEGNNVLLMGGRELRALRGSGVAYISQDPMVALDPSFSVGSLLIESIRHHDGVSRRAARARAIELLQLVNLPDPAQLLRRYPHQLSGGMAQRVAIARAIAGRPKLLIADEPTTALDVTVQAEVLDLLRSLQGETGMAILLITHDCGVVADLAHRIVVLYAGQVVEQAAVRDLFRTPAHPYTEGLLSSDPHLSATKARLPSIPGTVLAATDWPVGCRFQARCAYATVECGGEPISLGYVDHRQVRCIHADQVLTLAARQ